MVTMIVVSLDKLELEDNKVETVRLGTYGDIN